MTRRSATVFVEENFTLKITGQTLEIYYLDKLLETKNLRLYRAILKDHIASTKRRIGESIGVDADDEDIEAKAKLKKSIVFDFIKTYKDLKYKYTRQHSTYGEKSKFFPDFVLGATQALKMKVDHQTYIECLITKYGEINRESKVVIPYPRQLHGESAEMFIHEVLARRGGSTPDAVRINKLAQRNRRVPLDRDEQYQEIKHKFRDRSFTKQELEYVRIRQIQVYGEVKPWLAKYELELKEREAGGEEN